MNEPVKYRCGGGDGCQQQTGCEFVAIGKPEPIGEKVYMCPFNHWRACRWEIVQDTPWLAKGGGKGEA